MPRTLLPAAELGRSSLASITFTFTVTWLRGCSKQTAWTFKNTYYFS